MLRALVLVALLAAGACGGKQKPEQATTAVLQFDSNVSDAEVWIDGRYFADALRRGIRLPPGEHRIEVRHDEYHTRYFVVALTPGERETLEVQMAEILP